MSDKELDHCQRSVGITVSGSLVQGGIALETVGHIDIDAIIVE